MYLKHQPGDIIQDRYRITGILGQGGVAITYSAINLETEESVAVKVISLKQLDNWKQVELFGREAEVLSKLDHPAIPKYIDYFDLETDIDKAFYIVQQQAPGKSLFDLVQSGWHTNEAEVKDIAQQVLAILTYLHSLDPPVIHRDIKPNNLIRSDDGKIYLVDFGAVQNTYYNTLMQGSTVVGTYGYMAPEQFRGQALPASDLYSLGATLLYLLTHRSPAELPQDTLKLDFRSSVDISESFADWLDKILEPDVDDRFTNANEALTQLFASKKKNKELIARLVRLNIVILIIGLFTSIYYYKWFFLSRLGYLPKNLCFSRTAMEDYLNTRGKANIEISLNKYHKQSLLNCTLDPSKIYVIKRKENYNHKDIKNTIKHLLKENIDIESKDRFGNTPLIYATELKKTDVMKLLIQNGANVNAKNDSKNTPLHQAINQKNLEATKILIKNGANVNAINSYGRTSLHQAILQGNSDIIKLLIEHGADINAENTQGTTTISIAAKYLDKNIIQMLIDLDANVHHRDKHNQTPLFYATGIEVFKKLIDAGADVNAQDDKKETPLFNAVHYSSLDVAQLLIDKGADVNAISSDGSTPIFHSIRDKNTQLLIDNGADINHRNLKGETPLFYVWHQDLVRVLIENGADVNAKDKEGKTPLTDAIVDRTRSDRHIDNLKLLIDNGADVNEINYEMIVRLYDLTEHQHKKIRYFLTSQQFKKLLNNENN